MESALIKTVFSLLAVLGLMFGIAWAFKKYFLNGKLSVKNSVNIEVLGRHSLQPRHTIYVLKVLNKIFVVGVTEKGIFNLTEISNKENVDNVGQGYEAGLLAEKQEGFTSENSGFISAFSKYLNSAVSKLKESK